MKVYGVFGTILALFVGLLSVAVESTPATVDTEGLIQLLLSEATDPRNAVLKAEFDLLKNTVACLDAPVALGGLGVTVTSRTKFEDRTEADIAVSGSCAAGYELVIPSSRMTCTATHGWVDAPYCAIKTCENSFDFGAESSNCTAGQTSDYGSLCSLQCTGISVGDPIAFCGDAGWETNFRCESSVMTCGIYNSGNLGDPSVVSNKVNGATLDLASVFGTNVLMVESGYTHFCAINSAKDLICVGSNNNYQIADSGTSSVATTPFVSSAFVSLPIDDFQGGDYHYAVLSAGSIYIWGRGANGQQLSGSISKVNTPTLRAVGGTIVKMYLHDYTTIVELDDGTFVGGGHNSYASLGQPTAAPDHKRTLDVSFSGTGKIIHYEAGHDGGVLVTDEGEAYAQTASTPYQFCLSAATPSWEKTAGGIQGTIVMVKCRKRACAFETNDGKIHLCRSGTMTIGGVDEVESVTPIDITAALNDGCSTGQKRNKIVAQYSGLLFHGSCPGVYSLALYSGASCTEQSTAIDKLMPVASLPGTYSQVSGGYDHVAILK